MDMKHVAKASIKIKASPKKVWEALTTPSIIKEYLFGTEAKTDWKVGSPITYTGVWEGKPYEDKGTILKIIPETIIEMTYWSPAGGLADVPENYKKVTYELAPEKNETKLTITQDNNATPEAQTHSEQNWKMVLKKLKEVVEKRG